MIAQEKVSTILIIGCYLRLPLTSAIDTNTVVIPHVKAGEMRQTQRVLEELNINIQGKIADSGKEVWGSTHAAPQAVVLESRGIMQNFVPSVIGMGAKDAVYLLESKGLKVNLVGVGKVKRKTGQQLFIKWEKPMQEIIDRYDTQGSPYLLPIIRF